MKNVFLYVATGKKYVEEALNSVRQLKKIDDSAPAVLYTDVTLESLDTERGGFDKVIQIEKPYFDFQDKIEAMLSCDAEKIIFIDTDTYQVSKFDLWGVLDDFDLAFCYDPIRWDFDLPEVPEAVPTPNTGLLAFSKNAKFRTILENWRDLYEEQMKLEIKPLHDQPAFRKALYESESRFLVLPEEFNLRVSFPYMVPGNVQVKMLHGRHDNLTRAIKATERVEFVPRVYEGIYRKGELWELLRANLVKRLPFLEKKKKNDLVNKP